MRPDPELRLLALYPDRMNIYADRGNIVFLRERCRRRGIEFRYQGGFEGDTFEVDDHDLIYIGGGQDRDQRAVAQDLIATKRDYLTEAVSAGVPLLAVCGGYQLLGHSYQLDRDRLPGLGLADLETVREPGPRLVGNVSIETRISLHSALPAAETVPRGDSGGPRLVGFENHGGRTSLGSAAEALGRVERGYGNNGRDGNEGVMAGSVIGTYLHGPLLPKNWWLADQLIAQALERRYGQSPPLIELPDHRERAANQEAFAAVVADRR